MGDYNDSPLNFRGRALMAELIFYLSLGSMHSLASKHGILWIFLLNWYATDNNSSRSNVCHLLVYICQ